MRENHTRWFDCCSKCSCVDCKYMNTCNQSCDGCCGDGPYDDGISKPNFKENCIDKKEELK